MLVANSNNNSGKNGIKHLQNNRFKRQPINGEQGRFMHKRH